MSVCITAVSGALDRDFVVTVSTADNTAIINGMCIILYSV